MTADSHALTTEHSLVAGLAHDQRGGISNPVLGMLLFITSEVMFFAGLFGAYFTVRASTRPWPPADNPHFNLHEDPWKAAILTVILVTSSFTCQLGIWAIRRDDRRGLVRGIAVTLVLGIAFLLGQAYDYSQLGFGLTDGTFGTTFFTLTGFHGGHVAIGVTWLATLLVLDVRGRLTVTDALKVEIAGLYWHFVDIVWIAIFTLVYLIP